LLIESLVSSVVLQLNLFPNRRPVIPAATMLAMLNIYRKMLAFNDGFSSVLEIGPGCGYSSILLSQHKSLTTYAQIEVCQSLYLLQSAINLHAFGVRAKEHATLDLKNAGNFFGVTVSGDWTHIPEPDYADIPEFDPLCEHFPWWRIGDVAERESSFDIVTSNANLGELTPTALNLYLNLLNKVLKPDGLFLVQCSGADIAGRRAQLQRKLMEHNFAVAHFCTSGTVFDQTSTPGHARSFAKDSILIIKEGHPAYGKYYGEDLDNLDHFGTEEFANRMYFENANNRQKFTAGDIVQMVNERVSKLEF